MQKDISEDGTINIDGFKSALLGALDLKDHKITLPQLNEIFNLISDNKQLHYVEYICAQADNARPLFQRLKGFDKIDQSINLNESSINIGVIDQSLDLSQSRATPEIAGARQSIK